METVFERTVMQPRIYVYTDGRTHTLMIQGNQQCRQKWNKIPIQHIWESDHKITSKICCRCGRCWVRCIKSMSTWYTKLSHHDASDSAWHHVCAHVTEISTSALVWEFYLLMGSVTLKGPPCMPVYPSKIPCYSLWTSCEKTISSVCTPICDKVSPNVLNPVRISIRVYCSADRYA